MLYDRIFFSSKNYISNGNQIMSFLKAFSKESSTSAYIIPDSASCSIEVIEANLMSTSFSFKSFCNGSNSLSSGKEAAI